MRAKRAFAHFLRDATAQVGHDQTTSTSELERVCYPLFGSEFLGVHAQDRTPVPHGHRTYTIINLDTTGMPGSHWVARYTEGDVHALYDSYARAAREIMPLHRALVDTDLTPDAAVDQRKVGPGSKSCGQRCVAALLVARAAGMPAFLAM